MSAGRERGDGARPSMVPAQAGAAWAALSLPGMPALSPAALLALARQAGQAILAVYRGGNWAVQRKADASPLTRADLQAHALIGRGLRALTPPLPVVSEEDESARQPPALAQAYWLVDPLDGTREFIGRHDEFTVNIALIVQGRARWGVVHAPALDLMYWGGAGLGAWRQAGGETVSLACSALPADGVLRVLASRSHLDEATQQWIARLGPHRLLRAGSSLKFCRIAEGQADLYPRLGPTCAWDTAAAQAVLEGAGGAVRDLAGQPLRYDRPEARNPHFLAASAAWWRSQAAA